MTIGLLALTVAALFSGAALYVNIAEQPARLLLDDRALLAEWKPAYKRGAIMQASLALIGFLLGLASWWRASHAGFLIGTIAIIAPWPWTLVVIKPVNDRLLATAPNQAGAASRALIVTWGTLHAVRTALGAVATLAFLWALMTR
jgi:hypothetical protein